MTKADDPQSGSSAIKSGAKKPLTPAAERALAEVAERRARQQAQEAQAPAAKEAGGPSGPEPTRYGDWEKKGLASDF